MTNTERVSVLEMLIKDSIDIPLGMLVTENGRQGIAHNTALSLAANGVVFDIEQEQNRKSREKHTFR